MFAFRLLACSGDFPDRYLMTARKKGGTSASQFAISMDDGDDADEDNIVGRLKATSRTSEEFQVSLRCFSLLAPSSTSGGGGAAAGCYGVSSLVTGTKTGRVMLKQNYLLGPCLVCRLFV